jgi:predicted dehydrogenase
MPKIFNRREVLKKLGWAVGATLPLNALAKDENGTALLLPTYFSPIAKPITAITIGAGNRGNVYGSYAINYPTQLDIVGVAEPIATRNDRYAKLHNINASQRFQTWEEVFKKPKIADAVIISTPDNLHYEPCMAALKAGYHILLEKPISPSEEECRNILALAKKTNRIIAVCHVLRYAPYFVKLREIIQSGVLGEVVSVQHLEPIGHLHMSHSYVRGNWRDSKTSAPIILAKSCHDLDILRWLINKPATSIHALGNLKWFTSSHAPAGSTDRCTSGCAVESTCPYSAMKFYHKNRQRLYVFDLPEEKEKQGDYIMEQLRTTNYGRCVYKMDNNQPDHYTTNIQFAEGVTASFSMEAFTSYEGRRTRIMGSLGDIVGDMEKFTHTDFRTGTATEWKQTTDMHGGGDWRLVANWVQAIAQNNAALLTSTIDVSVESHIMGFMAERSRVDNKVMGIAL